MDVYDLGRESNVFQLLMDWCREDPPNRTVELYITERGAPRCVLRDRAESQHTTVAMGAGLTLRDAAEEAVIIAKRWNKEG